VAEPEIGSLDQAVGRVYVPVEIGFRPIDRSFRKEKGSN